MHDQFHFEPTDEMALLCWKVVSKAFIFQEYIMKIVDAADDFRRESGVEYQELL